MHFKSLEYMTLYMYIVARIVNTTEIFNGNGADKGRCLQIPQIKAQLRLSSMLLSAPAVLEILSPYCGVTD